MSKLRSRRLGSLPHRPSRRHPFRNSTRLLWSVLGMAAVRDNDQTQSDEDGHGMDLLFVFNTLAIVTGPAEIAGLDPTQELGLRSNLLDGPIATRSRARSL
jgi:hypothetical protein